jgi:hypothetical protein
MNETGTETIRPRAGEPEQDDIRRILANWTVTARAALLSAHRDIAVAKHPAGILGAAASSGRLMRP